MVQDLHSITPDHFLEVSGAVIHPLSYQQARNFRFNCGLVYVAEPGYMLFRAGVPRHSIIKKFAGEDISKLEDLISVLSKLSRGARVPLEYINYKERHQRKSVLVTIDRHEWYAPSQIYKRDDSSGLWTAKLALQQECPLLVSGIYPVENHAESCTSEVNPKDYRPEQVSQESMDGVASMEISDEHVTEGPNAQDDSDNGTKKRRVDENSSEDVNVIDDCSLNEHREERLDESGSVEDAVLRDYQGAAHVEATSVAERVIEPTLVMFE
ncbi:serine protease, partial [Datura stramonium]|nr:serine protease [Datura stramonium]